MDPETYETVTLQENLLGDAKDFLVENLPVQVLYAEGKAVQVELPASVSLKVIESAQGVRGDTASNVTKPAKLETGKTINVPLFIKEGETIKIDTRTGAYMQLATFENATVLIAENREQDFVVQIGFERAPINVEIGRVK